MYGSADDMHAVPLQLDAHGGHRLPDGTVSYVHSGGFQQQPYQQPTGSYPPPQQYSYESQSQQAHGPPGAPNGPSRDEKSEESAESKEANLPPPEVARMIPCRFFPNCRYEDKCIFAHPVAVPAGGNVPEAVASAPATNAAGPTSPAANNTAAAAPVSYQPPPGYGGYGQAPPYGPPQHFYMGPPMPMQYSHAGVPLPLHFPPPPPPPHAHGHPDQVTSAGHQAPNEAFSPSHHFQPHLPQHVMHQQYPYPPPQNVGGPNGEVSEPNMNQNQGQPLTHTGEKSGEEGKVEGEKSGEEGTNEKSGKSSHRRQSFNSFLHHHAIPFQPNASTLAMGASGSVEGGAHGFSGSTRGKRGRGGINGTYNRAFRSTERPPCTFFLKGPGACRYGENCAFPHYLADGTDCRTPAAIAGETKRPPSSYGAGFSATHPNGASGSTRGRGSGRGRGSHAHSGSVVVHPLPSGPAATSLSTQSAFPNVATAPVAPQGQKEAATSADAEVPTNSAPQAPAASNEVAPSAPPTSESSKQPETVKTESTTTTTTTTPAAVKPVPSQPSSSIPPKPVEATNSLNNKENEENKENKEKENFTSNSNSNQAPNSGNAGSEKKKASTASSAAASGVPAKPRTNGSGRGNSNSNSSSTQNSTARKVAAQSQRVPNVDDFPALGGLGGSSAASASSDSTAATPTTQPPKINFSAILSAPAPVKETAATPASEEKPSKEGETKKEKKEKKEKDDSHSRSNKSHVNGHHNVTSPPVAPVAPKKAAPQVDADGFAIVGKHGSKNNNQSVNSQKGSSSSENFAGVSPSSQVAA